LQKRKTAWLKNLFLMTIIWTGGKGSGFCTLLDSRKPLFLPPQQGVWIDSIIDCLAKSDSMFAKGSNADSFLCSKINR